MAHAPSALFGRFVRPVVAKMRGLVPELPRVPLAVAKFIVVPAERLKLVRMRSACAYVPTACTLAVRPLAPCAEVTAPTVSLLLLFARPLKVSRPPRMVIGAASLRRFVLSIQRPT